MIHPAMENALSESPMDSRAGAACATPPLSTKNAFPCAATVSRFAGRKVHFIGIGGSGMSGLARMLIDCGAVVSGSEPQPNPQTFALTKHGAKISRDQLGELLGGD